MITLVHVKKLRSTIYCPTDAYWPAQCMLVLHGNRTVAVTSKSSYGRSVSQKWKRVQPQVKLYLAVFDLSQATDFKRMKELSNVYMQWIFTVHDLVG